MIPGSDPPGPGPKFDGFTLSVPQIPRFAKATNFAPGGVALVGEMGPELVNLPRGSQVIPNNVAFGSGLGGRTVVTLSRETIREMYRIAHEQGTRTGS